MSFEFMWAQIHSLIRVVRYVFGCQTIYISRENAAKEGKRTLNGVSKITLLEKDRRIS